MSNKARRKVENIKQSVQKENIVLLQTLYEQMESFKISV